MVMLLTCLLDDIEFKPPTPSVYGIIGGAGSFAVIGARIVAGAEHGKAVSWILDAGSDFPADMMNTILSWDTGCVIREDKSRQTTRAWNGYGENEKRGKAEDALCSKADLTKREKTSNI
jgi:hypothetical protein